ncbi:MAG: DNA recombination protein RmuC [Prolixibacteraceae bacterium]
MELLLLPAGLAVGFIVAFLVFMLKRKGSEARLQAAGARYEIDMVRLEEKIVHLRYERDQLADRLERSESEKEEQLRKLASAETELINLQEKLLSRKKEIEDLQKKFTTEFENIAHRILKQNSEEFTQVNQKNISGILDPLREKIQLFEHKVQETYEKGLKDQTDLRAELKKLQDLNLKISDDATNLTKALRGDVKKQGNWGEVILERILERSGLTEGREYEKQFSISGDDGLRLQPDIVIHLPEQKHIVIDAKVSLVAYDRLVNAIDEPARLQYTKEHLLSVRSHVRLLKEKYYQNLASLNSPDFVLLFVPIESSFSVAVQADQELFTYAWDNKVVIVSPSTLLATLRTIASVWQQENQTRNAVEIARQGGALYDKFAGFVGDLEKIGLNLDQTRKNYDLAVGKLYTGKGNLLRSAERLRELGAKTNKELPKQLLED